MRLHQIEIRRAIRGYVLVLYLIASGSTTTLFRHPHDPGLYLYQFENYTTAMNIAILDWKRLWKIPSLPTVVS
jgi:hypothetical protein